MKFNIDQMPKYSVMLIGSDEEGDIFEAYLKSKMITIRGCNNIKDLRRVKPGLCINYNSGSYGTVHYYRSRGYRILRMRDFDGWEEYETVLDWDSTALDDFLSLFSCVG